MFEKRKLALIVAVIIVGAIVYTYLGGFFAKAPPPQVTVERYNGEVGEGQTFGGLTPEASETDDREATLRFRDRERPRVMADVGGNISVTGRDPEWRIDGNMSCEMYRSIPTPRESISSPYTIENFVIKWRREGDYKVIIITNTRDNVSKTFRMRVEETR